MKAAQIILLICWTLVVVLLVAVLVAAINGWNIPGIHFRGSWIVSDIVGSGENSDFDGTIPGTGEAEVEANGIEKIDIVWRSGEVLFLRHGEDTIKFVQAGNNIDNNQKMKYIVEGNELKIRDGDEKWLNLGRWRETYLTIYIPESVELVDEISVSGAATGINITEGFDGFGLGRLELDTASGEIEVSGVSCTDVYISSVSGSVKFEGIDSEELSVESVSGNITAEDAISDRVYIETVSGGAVMSGSFREVDSETVSGSMSVSSAVCPDRIASEAISGSFTLQIPENEGFTLEYSKKSGKISCSFVTTQAQDMLVYGNGAAHFSFDTVSGDVNIVKAAG